MWQAEPHGMEGPSPAPALFDVFRESGRFDPQERVPGYALPSQTLLPRGSTKAIVEGCFGQPIFRPKAWVRGAFSLHAGEGEERLRASRRATPRDFILSSLHEWAVRGVAPPCQGGDFFARRAGS